MLEIAFVIALILHGVIHFIGFARSLRAKDRQSPAGSMFTGCLWLIAGLLSILSAILYIYSVQYWWIAGLAAGLLSQTLIFTSWKSAKYGSVVNVLLLINVAAGWGTWRSEHLFYRDVRALLKNASATHSDLKTTELLNLPFPVQQYIRYTGSVNRPEVKCMRVSLEGKIRAQGGDWTPIRSVQYNDFEHPTRLFFLKGSMKGVPVRGYHKYAGTRADMNIMLWGFYPIISEAAGDLDTAETVTFFNDMCFLAPATLINKNIRWQHIDSFSARAFFTNKHITISATLIFNRQGQLINFISEDRCEVSAGKRYRFSTPAGRYRNVNGYVLPTHIETIWDYPDGPFVYGVFTLKNVDYNDIN